MPNYGTRASLGSQRITVLTTAVGLTVPDGVGLITIQAEAQPVRWNDILTALPTSTSGQTIAVGQTLNYTEKNMSQLRFIEATVGGIIEVKYYGPIA